MSFLDQKIYESLLLIYKFRGFSRYDCTHEVLPNKEAVFKGEEVVRGRRISLVCRNEA